MPLSLGQLLQNRYHINALLGQGGMGAVYDGYDTRLNIRVAIKENQLATREAQQQFEREAQLLASLRHANLPRVTDHFVIPGEGQYLVMDFIEGDDLKQIMDKSGPQPQADVVRWADGVLDALIYLHGRNVIHRDIKPANIKITPGGGAVLVDFGIAKDVSATPGVTTTGARALTPGFAAPEQYGIEGLGHTDPRSDIYALGATMYALLSGEAPPDVLSRIARPGKFIPLARRELNLDSALAEVIDRAMMVEQGDRFQSAAEMKLALHGQAPSTLSVAPTIAADPMMTVPVPPESAAPARPSSPMQLAWIAIGAIVLIGLGVLLTGGGGRLTAIFANPTPTSAIEIPTATNQPSPTFTAAPAPTETQGPPSPTAPPPSTPIPDTPTVVPFTPTATLIGGGAGQIAFISNREGNFEIYTMPIGGSGFAEATRLTNAPAEDSAPVWSPDGSQIAFQTKRHGNWEIYLMQADGANQTRLTNNSSDDISPNWSPDGKQIVLVSFRDGNRELYFMNADGSGQTRLTSTAGNEGSPVWSPDGKKLAFESNRDGRWQVFVMDADGSNQARLTNTANAEDALHPRWSPDGGKILFDTNLHGKTEIYVMAADGSARTRLTTNEANDYEPAWSPDGTKILFVSERDGNPELYVMDADGSNPKRLTSNLGPDLSPAWRP
jgi:Tol biopolymer transport system component/serine/threonine protein kinase